MDKNENTEVNNSEENSEVNEQSQGEENNEENSIDSLLDSLDDDTDELGDNKEEDKGEETSGEFYKKVGNHEFKTQEEYDAFAKKNYGEVSRLTGEMKKLQEKLANDQGNSQEVQSDAQKDDQKDQPNDKALFWKIKTQEFYEDNPGSEEYKSLMGSLLKSNKANLNGKPNLELAYAKALRADGQKVPDHIIANIRAKSGRPIENDSNVKKNIMKSESGIGGRTSENYSSEDDVQGTSDFADKALLGF